MHGMIRVAVEYGSVFRVVLGVSLRFRIFFVSEWPTNNKMVDDYFLKKKSFIFITIFLSAILYIFFFTTLIMQSIL